MDEIVRILINAIISGGMLAVGMVVGAKLTSRSMVDEMDKWLARSEFFQAMKKIATDQTLIEEATEFFKEARMYVTSPEAKNVLKNAAELMKKFSETKTSKPPPPPPRK